MSNKRTHWWAATRASAATATAGVTVVAVAGCGVIPGDNPANERSRWAITRSGEGSTVSAPAPAAVPPGDYSHYVALGDSYASMATRDDLQVGSPEFCARSKDNYPAVLVQLSQVKESVDVTCAGATVEHILGPRETPDGLLEPQVEAVTKDTDLVTLSIGGNDLGFGDLARCVKNDECASLDPVIRERINEIPSRLDSVYEAIEEQHGGKDGLTIITTGYLPLLTSADDCSALDGISEENRLWAVALTFSLNLLIEDAAQRHGAIYVRPEEPQNHTVCAQPVDTRWVDMTGESTDSYPMHPTPAGQRAVAQAVARAARVDTSP